MSYLLQQTHSLLHHCLGASNSCISTCNETSDYFAPAWEEIEDFRSSFLQAAALASSAESLKILVEVTVMGCTDSLNIISLLERKSGKAESQQPGFLHLQSSLADMLSWLHTRFNNYINEGMALPDSLAEQECTNIRHTLSAITNGADASVCGEWLITVSNLVKSMFKRKDALPSCRQVSYIKSLLTEVQQISGLAPADIGGLDAWAKTFIRCNCNDASVIEHINRKMSVEVSDILSLTGRIEKWHGFKKEITRITECGMALHPGAGSVKASLLSAIAAELLWLEQKEETLSSVYGNKVSSSDSPLNNNNPLLTTLSVSQLAVWCRLLHESDILKHGNQTELLKMVASSLQTTRATNISADSLRAKYYSPDRSALAVVKEQLVYLLKSLYTFRQ